MLTESVLPESDAGLLFMHNDGFSPMSAHGVIATTAIALDRGLLLPRDPKMIVYDTAAGTIRARAEPAAGSASRAVRFVSPPAFVLIGGLSVQLGSRRIRADVAFGGAFYAIVDSEAAGVAADIAHFPELRRLGMEIQRGIDRRRIEHPLDPRLTGIEGTVFTGPANDPSVSLRTVTVFARAAVDRSPCGTAMSAVMAVLSAMNLLEVGQPFICEGVTGTTLTGRVERRTTIGEHDAIETEIGGSAWLTGEHTFVVDDNDPLCAGVLV
jgi:proline racemase